MKLYVWRSSWDGMWHVSRDPKPETPYAAHMGRHHGKRFWTHRQAFADAWARTHPKEAPMADLERRNPYRSPSGCGCDLTGMAPPAVHIVDNHEGGAS